MGNARVFKQTEVHDEKSSTSNVAQVRKGSVLEEPAEADLEPGFQPRRIPRLPMDDEIAMEHGCFPDILSCNRGSIRVEGIRDSYSEQKKLDVVWPVNARH